VVRIVGAEGSDYAVVASNTANTLYFDSDLFFPIQDGESTVQIISTLVLEDKDLNTIIAVRKQNNHGAILLPKATQNNERFEIHAYVEYASNGGFDMVMMCRGDDRQAGVKYGTLEHTGEGVRLSSHQWGVPHWDIVDAYNIKRLAAGYTTQAVAIPSAEWTVMSDYDSVEYDYKRRFIDHIVDGIDWLQYTSLLERTFFVSLTAIIEKTGGTGEGFVAIIKRDCATGEVTVLDERVGRTRFGAGIGVQDVAVETPVFLKKGDCISYVARRTDGNFFIGAGSGIKIIEA
jgi:hypothetical protein